MNQFFISLHWLIMHFLFAFFVQWSVFLTKLDSYPTPPPLTNISCAQTILLYTQTQTLWKDWLKILHCTKKKNLIAKYVNGDYFFSKCATKTLSLKKQKFVPNQSSVFLNICSFKIFKNFKFDVRSNKLTLCLKNCLFTNWMCACNQQFLTIFQN